MPAAVASQGACSAIEEVWVLLVSPGMCGSKFIGFHTLPYYLFIVHKPYNSKPPENNSNLQKKASYARRLSWQILYPMQRQTYKALLEVRIQQPYSSNLQLRKKTTKETHVRIWVSISGWSVHSSHINGLFTRHWDHSPHASICIHMLVLLKGLQSKVLS